MSYPIVTDWTPATSPVTTEQAVEQSVGAWIEAHIARAQEELAGTPPQTSAPIVTRWQSAAGPQTVSTDHNGTETVDEWVARHWADVRAAMDLNPPVSS